MYPMGYYDYGFGLGYGMSQMVPPPAVVNHQADENVYVAHHESNDGATIALLSFAAIGSLAGLLIARKANKTTKLIDAVTHDLRETAKKESDDILKAGKEELRKYRAEAREYAGDVKDAAHSEARDLRKAAAEDVKTAEGLKKLWEERLLEIVERDAKRDKEVAGLKARIAELSKTPAPATSPIVAPRVGGPVGKGGVDTVTRARFPEPTKIETIKVEGTGPKFDKAAAAAAKEAAKEALPKAAPLIDEGVALCNKSKFEEALPKFLDSVKIYEDNLTHVGSLDKYHLENYSQSLNNAGYCYMRTNKPDEAIKYFAKSIEVHPDKYNQNALLSLSDCHRQLGNEGELAKCLKSLSDKGDIHASLELAGIKESQAKKFLSKTGATATDVAANEVKSTECYKQAAELYKKAAGEGNFTAKVKLANLYEHGPKGLKNDVEAAKLYRSAIEDCVLMIESGKADDVVVSEFKSLNIALTGLRKYSDDPNVAKLFEDKKSQEFLARVQDMAILSTKGGDPVPAGPGKKVPTLPGVGDPAAKKPPVDARVQIGLGETAPGSGRLGSPNPPAVAPSAANAKGVDAPSSAAPAPAPAPAPAGADASKGNGQGSASVEANASRRVKPEADKPAPRGFFGKLADLKGQIERREITAESLSRDVQAKLAALGAKANASVPVKPSKAAAPSTATAGAGDVFAPSSTRAASSEAKVGKDTIIPTGDEAATGVRPATEGLKPEGSSDASRAAEPPSPDMPGEVAEAQGTTTLVPTGEEAAGGASRAAEPPTPKVESAAESAAGDVVPRPEGVEPQAAAAPAPAPAPVAEGSAAPDLGKTAVNPPAENVLLTEQRVATDPNATHVGNMPIAQSRRTGPAPATVEPAVAEAATPVANAEAAAPKAEQVAEAAEALVTEGQLVKDAQQLFTDGKLDEGFAKLYEAEKAGQVGAKENLYFYFTELMKHPKIDAAKKEPYLQRAIDSFVEASQSGVEEASQLLKGAYESGTLGGINMPAEGEAFGKINDQVLRILSKE